MNKKIVILAMAILLLSLAIPSSAAPLGYEEDFFDSNKFWIDEQVWNAITKEWMPPTWYQYWSNATSGPYELIIPPAENQTDSFYFNITSDESFLGVVSMMNFMSPLGAEGNYTGPIIVDEGEWISITGIIIACNGPYEENASTSLSGYVNASHWETGWKMLWIHLWMNGDNADTQFVFYLNDSIPEPEASIMEPIDEQSKALEVQIIQPPFAEAFRAIVDFLRKLIDNIIH